MWLIMGVIKIGSDEFTGSKTYQFEEDVQIDPEKEEKILNEFKPIYCYKSKNL